MFNLTGLKVYRVGDTQVVSEKFKKRELVAVIQNDKNPDWDDYVSFEAIQDNCSLLDAVGEGDTVTIEGFIKGRKWVKDGAERFFNTLQIKTVTVVRKAETISGQYTTQPKAPVNNISAPIASEGPTKPDDLPF